MNAATPWLTARRTGWIGLLIWLAACAVFIGLQAPLVENLVFRDPDDALRLVQVRDWLAGQGWFDLVQHRLNPPGGVAMHWSRIVDLPIAALIASLTPFAGQPLAEQVALVVVPLLLLGGVYALAYALTFNMTGSRGTGVLALLLLCTLVPVVNQFAPLRIDHHGWQILLGALAVTGLVDRDRPERGAAIAGFAFAAWMQVSIEGLPLTVMAGALLALRFALAERHWPVLRAFLASLAASLATLQLAFRGTAGFAESWCDALALPYLAPLIGASATMLVLVALLGTGRPARRIAALVLAGAAGIGLFVLNGSPCLAGPFATLDPLTRELWYLRVLEGLPIERQGASVRVLILAPSLLGLVATSIAAWRAADAQARARWLTLLWLLACAALVSTRVARAMDLAHLLTLPGVAWALIASFRVIRAMRAPLLRILLTPLLALMTPLGVITLGSALVAESRFTPTDISQCTTKAGTRGLAALPAATLFTPLDIGAHLLAYSHHSIVATGHHRNREGMERTIRAFLAQPDEAHRLIAATPARYVAFCPRGNEARDFFVFAPTGLAARLARGQTPDWLERVPMPRSERLLVYRIRATNQAGRKLSATPFMQ